VAARLRGLIDRFLPAAPPLEPPAAYKLWAAAYPPEAHNPLMQAEEKAGLELLARVSMCGARALDLACGTGRYLRHLQAAGAQAVIGLDLSAEMLARARAEAAGLAQADMLALPLAASSFDVVVCGLAVGHVPRLEPMMCELARVLKTGGALVYSDFHPFGHLAGWKRGFRANGREYSVRHHLHLYADHHAACRAAGLAIQAVAEPVAVNDRGERAWGDIPVALVLCAVKIDVES
jgi:malonyl-CoA O-methyltransferase